MVAVFLSLKLRLLRNGFRGSTAKVLAAVVAACVGSGLALGGLGLAVGLRGAEVDTARTVLVLVGSALTLGWTVLPIVVFGVDETLDPVRFGLFPIERATLLRGLLVAGLVGVPPLATGVFCLATVVTWSRGAQALLVALLAAAVALALCLAASRAVTSALAPVLRSRRARDLVFVAVVLAASSIGLVNVAVVELAEDLPRAALDRVVDVLAWTPLGAAWAAPADAAAGAPGLAAARLAIAAVSVAGLLWWWSRTLEDAVLGGTTRSGPAAAGGQRSLAPRWAARMLPDTAAGAVAARSLRMWTRDPRLRTNVLVLPAVGVAVLAGPVLLGGSTGLAVAAGPFLGALLALSVLNETAYDGTAFWTHLAAGLPGRLDRQGRSLGYLVWALPLVVATGALGPLLGGRPALAPAGAAAGASVLLVGCAVGSVVNVVAAYPVPDAQRNPFATNTGGSVATMLQQLVAGLVIGALSIPVLAGVAAAWFWPWAGVPLLVLGPLYGTVLLRFGWDLGGAHLDQRGPELLATITPPS